MAERKRKKKPTKRERQLRRRLLFGTMGVVIVLLAGVLAFTLKNNSDKESGEESNKGENVQVSVTPTPTDKPNVKDEPTPTATPTPQPLPSVSLEGLDSTSIVLVRSEDEQIICEMDADRVLYPASMTKIMTALVAIENIPDLNGTMKIKQSTYDGVYLQGASLAGFPCGEEVKIIDVLYGIMLPSGAECCVGIAEHLFGSEEALVAKMNEKAAQIGMTKTHFVTSTGLHDDEHYTTVKDLAKLVKHALTNETFKELYGAKTYTTSPMKKNPKGMTFHSTMFARMGNSEIKNGQVLGGKTGYTGEAGNCLASYAVVDGVEYILVTAGSMKANKMGAVEDALAIYNQISDAQS